MRLSQPNISKQTKGPGTGPVSDNTEYNLAVALEQPFRERLRTHGPYCLKAKFSEKSFLSNQQTLQSQAGLKEPKGRGVLHTACVPRPSLAQAA